MNALFIVPIFHIALLWLYFLTTCAPPLEGREQGELIFPSNMDELKALSSLLSLYYKNNKLFVFALFSSAYIFKQTFMIPGSALLNILGGALFGVWIALPMCCILTCCGSLCSYLLSKIFLKDIVIRFWGARVNILKKKVQDNEHRLIYFLLFLRLFPMSPNWLINLMSPLVGIPIHLFAFTNLVGLLPYNFISIQSGSILASIKSLDDIFTFSTFLQLGCLAAASFIPTVLSKKSKVN